MAAFPIAPASSRYIWFFIPVTALLVGVVVLLALSLRGSRASSFEVLADSLRLRGDLYGRTLPKSQLRLDLARRVNLDHDVAFRPRSRRVGTALPGYQAGWFRLQDGERALLYLTDRSRAVYVPTTMGYCLLLSPLDPDGFLAALRGRHG